MPYRDKRNEPDLDWTQYNPRRVGLVTFEESRRGVVLTEEQKAVIAARSKADKEGLCTDESEDLCTDESEDFDW